MKYVSMGMLCIFCLLQAGCATYKISAKQFIPRDPGQISNLKSSAAAYQFDDIEVKQADGAISRGIHAHKPDAEATVLYFMGNGVRLDAAALYFGKPFTQLNLNLITFDYRGFGRSDAKGQPIGLAQTEKDTLAIYDEIRKKIKGKLIVHGHSFGSFVVAKLASMRQLDAVVLEGTGTDAITYANNLTPWYAKPFIRIELDADLVDIDNRVSLNKSEAPLLIINGSEDVITPAVTARDLYESVQKKSKRYVLVTGADHMNAMSKEDTLRAYREFLNGKIN